MNLDTGKYQVLWGQIDCAISFEPIFQSVFSIYKLGFYFLGLLCAKKGIGYTK